MTSAANGPTLLIATLDELTRDLDRQFPGIRFRIIDEH